MKYRRAKGADAGEEVLLDVGLETPGALPATFTVLPKAMQLVVPA